MRVVHVSPAGRSPNTGAIFEGSVETQTVVGDESAYLRCTEVTFENGARNRLHVHATDQILVITAGEGIVATDSERHEVGPGDVALIGVGERHWHGARPGRTMTHLAIMGPGQTKIVGS